MASQNICIYRDALKVYKTGHSKKRHASDRFLQERCFNLKLGLFTFTFILCSFINNSGFQKGHTLHQNSIVHCLNKNVVRFDLIVSLHTLTRLMFNIKLPFSLLSVYRFVLKTVREEF